jgi:interferon-induced transmembrane protein/zinc ribbon protein
MFCPQCGASNADTAAICTQCGRQLQAVVPPAGSPTPLPVQGVVLPPGTTVPNYLVFAILATVFCCLPAGIPAIVFAAQVNGKVQIGDIAGAQAASNNAKMWCWISFGVGLAAIGVWVLLVMIGVVSGIHNNR